MPDSPTVQNNPAVAAAAAPAQQSCADEPAHAVVVAVGVVAFCVGLYWLYRHATHPSVPMTLFNLKLAKTTAFVEFTRAHVLVMAAFAALYIAMFMLARVPGWPRHMFAFSGVDARDGPATVALKTLFFTVSTHTMSGLSMVLPVGPVAIMAVTLHVLIGFALIAQFLYVR